MDKETLRAHLVLIGFSRSANFDTWTYLGPTGLWCRVYLHGWKIRMTWVPAHPGDDSVDQSYWSPQRAYESITAGLQDE